MCVLSPVLWPSLSRQRAPSLSDDQAGSISGCVTATRDGTTRVSISYEGGDTTKTCERTSGSSSQCVRKSRGCGGHSPGPLACKDRCTCLADLQLRPAVAIEQAENNDSSRRWKRRANVRDIDEWAVPSASGGPLKPLQLVSGGDSNTLVERRRSASGMPLEPKAGGSYGFAGARAAGSSLGSPLWSGGAGLTAGESPSVWKAPTTVLKRCNCR